MQDNKNSQKSGQNDNGRSWRRSSGKGGSAAVRTEEKKKGREDLVGE
jgi:hypothetical protein